MGRIGLSPPNKLVERNERILQAVRAGRSMQDIATEYGLTRERVSAIWRTYGDGRGAIQVRRDLHGGPPAKHVPKPPPPPKMTPRRRRAIEETRLAEAAVDLVRRQDQIREYERRKRRE